MGKKQGVDAEKSPRKSPAKGKKSPRKSPAKGKKSPRKSLAKGKKSPDKSPYCLFCERSKSNVAECQRCQVQLCFLCRTYRKGANGLESCPGLLCVCVCVCVCVCGVCVWGGSESNAPTLTEIWDDWQSFKISSNTLLQ